MWQDLKHGTRMLMKNPGFTFVAVISIAIGVGANAAMFSFADGLVFRPLPVPRASEVVTVSGQERRLCRPARPDEEPAQPRRLHLRHHDVCQSG